MNVNMYNSTNSVEIRIIYQISRWPCVIDKITYFVAFDIYNKTLTDNFLMTNML